MNFDLVWHLPWLSWFCRGITVPRPNWSGYMPSVVTGEHGPPAVIEMKPLLDAKSIDESCIFSTLDYVCKPAEQLNVTPCITFDQPLWLIAFTISSQLNLGVVCRLGGFHTLMSYLGSISSVMAGSGLEELVGVIYGKDTVSHIVSGKA